MRIKYLLAALLVLVLCTGCASGKTAGQAPPSGEDALFLVHCRVIDGTGAPPQENAVLVISGGKINAVTAQDAVSIPQGARVVDLEGATVLPGFINAHVHQAYSEEHLSSWLQAGVTTVRDEAPHIGGDFLAERDRLNQDLHHAFIVSATPILTVPGGYGTSSFDSPEKARDVVNGYISQGVDIVKTSIENDLQGRQWAMPTFDEIKAIVDAAHSGGRKVSVHISHVVNLQWAIDAGVDDIAHMVVEPLDAETAAAVAAKGIYWVPTLELWKGVSKMYALDWIDVAQRNVASFCKAGGHVALGTDFAGYGCTFDKGFPITEVTLMQQAGMGNMDIIVAGTKNAAHVCGIEDVTGTVEAGKYADLLVVSGDPLADLNTLLNVRMVMHRGQIVVDNAPAL